MAAYLSLRHKADGKRYTGAALIQVDEMLCQHLGVPCTEEWHNDWMNWIGFALAYQYDKPPAEVLASMRENARDNEQRIIDWFIDTFDNASYSGF